MEYEQLCGFCILMYATIGDSGILGISIYSKINKHNGWRRCIRIKKKTGLKVEWIITKTGFMYVVMHYLRSGFQRQHSGCT